MKYLFIFFVVLLFLSIFFLLIIPIPIGQHNKVVSYYNSPLSIYRGANHYSTIGGKQIFTGLQWECVEFVRRYYIHQFGLTFPNIENAIELTNLTHFTEISTGQLIEAKHTTELIPGAILVFPEGHCAIMTDKTGDGRIRLIEQNRGFSAFRTCLEGDILDSICF